MADDRITLFHGPQTRSSGTLFLLEELGAAFDVSLVDIRSGAGQDPAYLALNPMGKVPAIRHRGEIVTEQVAIFLYLADLHPEAGLAPALSDPLRGPYLRWFVFYGSCFEPAMIDRAMKREPAPRAMNPYGSFESVWGALTDRLAQGSYMLGERISALDFLWGPALNWMTQFKLAPESAVVADYVERITSRPLFGEVKRRDEAWLAESGAGQ